jgi:uncharacterized protein (DUF1330 family)
VSVYFIANIRIKDPAEYQKYLAGSDSVFQKYKGRYLAFDDRPEVLEGSWNYTRLVLIEFPDKKSLHDWYECEEYQSILKHRLTASDCDTVAIAGKSD